MIKIGIEVESIKAQDFPKVCLGKIQIGEFIERFESDISFWQPIDYVNQWKKGIKKIIDGGTKSCLITSISDPEHANFFFWWLLYRNDDIVHVQNSVCFLEFLQVPFKIEDPYPVIPNRETTSEDGSPISEWKIPVDTLSESDVKMW